MGWCLDRGPCRKIDHVCLLILQVKLKNGGELIARCFGRFNGTLWDDVFAELGPLTERDVIIVNFGAWYPRFNYYEIRVTIQPHQFFCGCGCKLCLQRILNFDNACPTLFCLCMHAFTCIKDCLTIFKYLCLLKSRIKF